MSSLAPAPFGLCGSRQRRTPAVGQPSAKVPGHYAPSAACPSALPQPLPPGEVPHPGHIPTRKGPRPCTLKAWLPRGPLALNLTQCFLSTRPKRATTLAFVDLGQGDLSRGMAPTHALPLGGVDPYGVRVKFHHLFINSRVLTEDLPKAAERGSRASLKGQTDGVGWS